MNDYKYRSGYLNCKRIKKNKPSKGKRFQNMIDKINKLKEKKND